MFNREEKYYEKDFERIVALLLILSFTVCGIKQKLEEKIGETLTEKILKDVGVDDDIDGGKVIINDEDGQKLAIGDCEWPSSTLAKSIPEYQGRQDRLGDGRRWRNSWRGRRM